MMDPGIGGDWVLTLNGEASPRRLTPADREKAEADNEQYLAGLRSAQFFTVKTSELCVRGQLGKGACADVFKADWTRTFAGCTSSIVVALKRLNTNAGPVYRDREALTLLTEHPNLVKCFDSTQDPPYLIVSEFCAGGSVADLLYNSKTLMCIRQRLKILLGVATGMRYLHAQQPCILHRDLKSANVLLTRPIRCHTQEPFAKIADFGLARSISIQSTMTLGVGTWRWMAPEVFTMEGDDESSRSSYDVTADIFSFAMLAYEVFERQLPYHDSFGLAVNDPRIGLHVCMGYRPTLTQKLPKGEFRSLVEASWATDPALRPMFEEVERKLVPILAAASDSDEGMLW